MAGFQNLSAVLRSLSGLLSDVHGTWRIALDRSTGAVTGAVRYKAVRHAVLGAEDGQRALLDALKSQMEAACTVLQTESMWLYDNQVLSYARGLSRRRTRCRGTRTRETPRQT